MVKDEGGMTLVELLAAITLSSIVMMMGISIIGQTAHLVKKQETEVNCQEISNLIASDIINEYKKGVSFKIENNETTEILIKRDNNTQRKYKSPSDSIKIKIDKKDNPLQNEGKSTGGQVGRVNGTSICDVKISFINENNVEIYTRRVVASSRNKNGKGNEWW